MTIAGRLLHGEFGFSHKALLRHKPENYLLLDRFGDAHAAGAVNGTPAEPGPGGSRVVVDTNSKLSIAGGEASFATGGLGVDNPGIRYPSLNRALGRTVLGSIVHLSGDNALLGFGNGSSLLLVHAMRFSSATTLRAADNSATIGIGIYDFGVLYHVAVVARLIGAFYFIKGGAFTNYTLVWISNVNSNALIYPGISGGATGILTADNLRVPSRLFIPVPLASDSFAGGAGSMDGRLTDGLGHAEQNGGDGKVWTDQVGTWAILTNAAAASALSGGLAIATVDTPSADAVIDVEATRSAGSVGGIARYQDANNYLRFYHEGTNAVCQQVVAGTPSTLRTGAATYSAGAVVRLILNGTTGRLFYNNVAVGAVFTVPASIYAAHGLYTTNTGNSLDDFQVWARGTGGEYEGLNQL